MDLLLLNGNEAGMFSSSRATVSCMRQNLLRPSVLRQGRVLHNVYLKALFYARAGFACARSSPNAFTNVYSLCADHDARLGAL